MHRKAKETSPLNRIVKSNSLPSWTAEAYICRGVHRVKTCVDCKMPCVNKRTEKKNLNIYRSLVERTKFQGLNKAQNISLRQVEPTLCSLLSEMKIFPVGV